MLRSLCLLALAALSLAFAPAPLPKPGDGKDDLKKMQGAWVLVTSTFAGEPVPRPAGGVPVVIAGDQITHFWGFAPSGTWTITLNEKREPKAIDLRPVPPGNATLLGLYRLQGDTLTIASSPSTDERHRPANFTPKAADAILLNVYKRKKR